MKEHWYIKPKMPWKQLLLPGRNRYSNRKGKRWVVGNEIGAVEKQSIERRMLDARQKKRTISRIKLDNKKN